MASRCWEALEKDLTSLLKIFKFSLRGFAGLVFDLEFQLLNFGEFL